VNIDRLLVICAADAGCNVPCVRHGDVDSKSHAFRPRGAELCFAEVPSLLSQMLAEHSLVGGCRENLACWLVLLAELRQGCGQSHLRCSRGFPVMLL